MNYTTFERLILSLDMGVKLCQIQNIIVCNYFEIKVVSSNSSKTNSIIMFHVKHAQILLCSSYLKLCSDIELN